MDISYCEKTVLQFHVLRKYPMCRKHRNNREEYIALLVLDSMVCK